jgi:hypothetical protein
MNFDNILVIPFPALSVVRIVVQNGSKSLLKAGKENGVYNATTTFAYGWAIADSFHLRCLWR